MPSTPQRTLLPIPPIFFLEGLTTCIESKTMTDTEDPIRLFLLSTLADGKSKAPQELAQAFHASRAKPSDPPDAWRRYLTAIRQQSLSLARLDLVEFLRKGKAVAPDEIKGVVRIRLKRQAPET
jgi:hypothetical protein